MLRRRIVSALFAPVDIASLVAFRVAFGALMVVAISRYFAHDWIGQFFVTPRLFFPYPGLEWIVPLRPEDREFEHIAVTLRSQPEVVGKRPWGLVQRFDTCWIR